MAKTNGVNLTPEGKKQNGGSRNSTKKNNNKTQKPPKGVVNPDATLQENLKTLNDEMERGSSEEHKKNLEWVQSHIAVDLTPSPINVFGTEFVTEAKEFLYKSFDNLAAAKTPDVDLIEDNLPEWSDLLETYILENLGEEEKIAKIVTEENKEAFKSLIRMFLADDEFRTHLLYLCANAETEKNDTVVENNTSEEVKSEEPQPFRKVVNLTPEEPVDGDVEEDKVFLFSKKSHVVVTEGATKTVEGETAEPSAETAETVEEPAATEGVRVEADIKSDEDLTIEDWGVQKIIDSYNEKQEKKSRSILGRLFKLKPHDVTQAILNRTVTPPNESRKFNTDFWKKAK